MAKRHALWISTRVGEVIQKGALLIGKAMREHLLLGHWWSHFIGFAEGGSCIGLSFDYRYITRGMRTRCIISDQRYCLAVARPARRRARSFTG